MGSQLTEERRPRGRPPSSDDDLRRVTIVGAAHHMFLAAGYRATSMGAVATQCHISKQTLYRLFPSKFELFTAVTEAFQRTLLALPRPPDESLSLAETLERIFEIDIDPAVDVERMRFFERINAEAIEHPEIGELICERGIDRAVRLMADWLVAQQASGRLVVDDPQDTAAILLDMTFGSLAVHYRRKRDTPNSGWRCTHIRRAIRLFLDGTRVPTL